jgi:hypothetical protein
MKQEFKACLGYIVILCLKKYVFFHDFEEMGTLTTITIFFCTFGTEDWRV